MIEKNQKNFGNQTFVQYGDCSNHTVKGTKMRKRIYFIEDEAETQDSRVLLNRTKQPIKMNLEEISAANLELRHDLAILKSLEAQFQEEFVGVNSPECTLMKFRYRFEAAVPRFHLPETSAVIPVKIHEFSYVSRPVRW